jgi:uncharacterized membrane protein
MAIEEQEQRMSALVVLMFDQEEEAGKARDALRNLEHSGNLDLEDTAVVVRDTGGKVHVHRQVSDTTKAGAVGGGFLGLFLAFLFPVVGIAVGVAAGALLGRLLDRGVEGAFVKEVGDALKPGNSALFVIVKDTHLTPMLAALRDFKGKVYHTNLDAEAEESLRRAVGDQPSLLS